MGINSNQLIRYLYNAKITPITLELYIIGHDTTGGQISWLGRIWLIWYRNINPTKFRSTYCIKKIIGRIPHYDTVIS